MDYEAIKKRIDEYFENTSTEDFIETLEKAGFIFIDPKETSPLIKKNIAIAEMIGMPSNTDEDGNRFWIFGVGSDCSEYFGCELLFHEDPTWQYEAINWVDQQRIGFDVICIFKNLDIEDSPDIFNTSVCYIDRDGSWDPNEGPNGIKPNIFDGDFKSRLEATFEGLAALANHITSRKK